MSHDPSVRALLGDRLGDVLEGGLATIPPDMIKRLLLQPTLLLELQGLVLELGGGYWDRVVPLSADRDGGVERGRERLSLQIGFAQSKVAWYRRSWFVSLATAASVLLVVIAYETYRSSTGGRLAAEHTAWGWNRSDALVQDLPAQTYLNHLAGAAEDWFKERPQEPRELAKRISEFRRGCTQLILSDHRHLSEMDRNWLVVRCRLWAGKLDKHLAALESGRNPVQVRGEVDETIHELIRALRARAGEVDARTRQGMASEPGGRGGSDVYHRRSDACPVVVVGYFNINYVISIFGSLVGELSGHSHGAALQPANLRLARTTEVQAGCASLIGNGLSAERVGNHRLVNGYYR